MSSSDDENREAARIMKRCMGRIDMRMDQFVRQNKNPATAIKVKDEEKAILNTMRQNIFMGAALGALGVFTFIRVRNRYTWPPPGVFPTLIKCTFGSVFGTSIAAFRNVDDILKLVHVPDGKLGEESCSLLLELEPCMANPTCAKRLYTSPLLARFLSACAERRERGGLRQQLRGDDGDDDDDGSSGGGGSASGWETGQGRGGGGQWGGQAGDFQGGQERYGGGEGGEGGFGGDEASMEDPWGSRGADK